jgi:hypothetical protein
MELHKNKILQKSNLFLMKSEIDRILEDLKNRRLYYYIDKWKSAFGQNSTDN